MGRKGKGVNRKAIRRHHKVRRRRIPHEVRISIGETQEWKCAYCDKDISSNFTLDHKVAIANGGGNKKTNLQLTCESCNVAKGAMSDAHFRKMRGILK